MLFVCLWAVEGLCAEQPLIWQQYSANALTYFQSRLPNPTVAFVYTVQGVLVSAIDMNGSYSSKPEEKAAAIIKEKRFDSENSTEYSEMSKRFSDFLVDQGYNLKEMISKKAQYTLIMTSVASKSCQDLADRIKSYEDGFVRAATSNGDGTSDFAFVALTLESPHLTVDCKH